MVNGFKFKEIVGKNDIILKSFYFVNVYGICKSTLHCGYRLTVMCKGFEILLFLV